MTQQTELEWLNQLFSAQQASSGGIVRRNIDDMHKNSSFPVLMAYVKERGFHLIETGDQYVIICNAGFIKLHC